MADSFEKRLASNDPSLFAGVSTTTTTIDRAALNTIQSLARKSGDYTYLEIGTHLGGTLQTHCADPRCRKIYAVDKRPDEVADIRGKRLAYQNNTSANMLSGLRAAFGDAIKKIEVFDDDIRDVPTECFSTPPDLCFIDGEHTIEAVVRDFTRCQAIASPDAIIAFHDSQLLRTAIVKCRGRLQDNGTPHRAMKLTGSVHAILLGDATRHEPALRRLAQSEFTFRWQSWFVLWRERLRFGLHDLRWESAFAAKLRRWRHP